MTKTEANKKWPKRNGYYYGELNGTEFKYPSITSVLNIFEKGFLVTWAAKKCAEIALDDPTLTVDEVYKIHRDRDVIAAGTRGKGVHNVAPKILAGEECDLNGAYKGYIDGLRTFINEHNPVQLFCERTVISHKYGIGGTTDWGLQVGRERWLTDIKTSSSIYRNHKVQLQFYSEALEEEGEKFDKRKIIHLPGDGTYSLVDVYEDISVLTHIKSVWEWTKEKN